MEDRYNLTEWANKRLDKGIRYSWRTLATAVDWIYSYANILIRETFGLALLAWKAVIFLICPIAVIAAFLTQLMLGNDVPIQLRILGVLLLLIVLGAAIVEYREFRKHKKGIAGTGSTPADKTSTTPEGTSGVVINESGEIEGSGNPSYASDGRLESKQPGFLLRLWNGFSRFLLPRFVGKAAFHVQASVFLILVLSWITTVLNFLTPNVGWFHSNFVFRFMRNSGEFLAGYLWEQLKSITDWFNSPKTIEGTAGFLESLNSALVLNNDYIAAAVLTALAASIFFLVFRLTDNKVTGSLVLIMTLLVLLVAVVHLVLS